MNPIISPTRTEAIIRTMTDHLTTVVSQVCAWIQADERSLQAIEEQVIQLLHGVGQTLVTEVLPLTTSPRPSPDVPCPCGQRAHYERMRPATVTTLLGTIPFVRAVYACPQCGQRQMPDDTRLQIAAGGFSLGVQEVLALLGATQDSFAQASHVFERLCLVHVCPNSARAATEDLGTLLTTQTHQVLAQAATTQTAPAAVGRAPTTPLYLSMDGVVAHIHGAGWKEIKTGCVYTTRTHAAQHRPEQLVIQAEAQSYLAALTDAESFGWQLWAEACRRGLQTATDVVVIGDGAHWIWNIAATHVPQATQIVDWYHASQYLWQAATAIFGEGAAQRIRWARHQLDALWDGQVTHVITTLEPYRAKGDAVAAAISYYTTHQSRMDYPAYRARGLQIGSGTIESTCKQLVSARLKLAGMIWDADEAEAVAVVRAWLKSDRWHEAMGLRPCPRRPYPPRTVPAAVAAA